VYSPYNHAPAHEPNPIEVFAFMMSPEFLLREFRLDGVNGIGRGCQMVTFPQSR